MDVWKPEDIIPPISNLKSQRIEFYLQIYYVFIIELLQDNLKEIGHDINVTGVWEHNITGKGVTVSVIDDGKTLQLLRSLMVTNGHHFYSQTVFRNFLRPGFRENW